MLRNANTRKGTKPRERVNERARPCTHGKFGASPTKTPKKLGAGRGEGKKIRSVSISSDTYLYTQESVQVFSAQTREQTLSRARVGVSAACVLCRKRVMEVAMEGWSESGEGDGCRTWVNYREKINTGPDSFD